MHPLLAARPAPGRAVLRLSSHYAATSLRGSTRPHTDTAGRIVVTEGLRLHLGLGPSDEVVVLVAGDGTVALAHPQVVVAALALVDAARAAVARTGGERTVHTA